MLPTKRLEPTAEKRGTLNRRPLAGTEKMQLRVVVSFIIIVLLGTLLGCAERIDKIQVPNPAAASASEQCAVVRDGVVTNGQALCIAKVSGLKPGVTRWQVREYPDYLDVFNTTTNHPVSKGFGVRIQRIGGRVLSIEPWEEITVR